MIDLFQSTLSSRRATGQLFQCLLAQLISIHALLTESDRCSGCLNFLEAYFNPRSPHGERPDTVMARGFGGLISIHALLTESDFLLFLSLRPGDNFNPRSPHGERPPAPRLPLHRCGISIHALLTESD